MEDRSYEEADAEVGPLEVIGDPYLIKRLANGVSKHIAFSRAQESRTYKPGYQELYQRYEQALQNVMKSEKKTMLWEKAKQALIEKLKT